MRRIYNLPPAMSVGADPELFLTRRGKLVSSVGIIGGTKEKPKPIPSLGDGFAVQEDNVMLEFNIPPAREFNQFNNSIESVLSHVRKEYKYSLRIGSAALFDDSQLNNEQAQRFGCDPDRNAWTVQENPAISPESLPNRNVRTPGGHIHIGFNKEEIIKRQAGVYRSPITQGILNHQEEHLVRAMDIYLGVPSVIMDADKRRVLSYGKAGNHRIKPYGVEYRTLSNFWIKSKQTRLWAWNGTVLACNALNYNIGIFANRFFNEKERIIHIINNSDVGEAILFCHQYSIPYIKGAPKVCLI